MEQSKEQSAETCRAIARAQFQDFLQVTAFKSLQFVMRSAHWTETIFWIVLLVGATGLAIRDLRKAYREYADEDTYTTMRVTGLERLTFDNAIVCVEYDPLALNVSDPQLIRSAEATYIVKNLAKRAHSSSVALLNRLQKLIAAISLTEHGRTVDYVKKVAELQRDDDLQELHDWLIKQAVDIADLSSEVGNWLCNSLRVEISTIKRGMAYSVISPCSPEKISWLGTIPFTSIATSEMTVCINISNLISFEGMYDRVFIRVHTETLNQSLPANNHSFYPVDSFVDFSGDPVSTDMTKDFITFPDKDCQSFDIGIDARLHLRDRWMARCNTTAKTRLACYADCDMLLYANTKLSNCTLLAWRYLYLESPKMCFDLFSIEEHVEARRLTPRTNVSGSCWTSCLFPCEFRQYDVMIAPGGCSKDNPIVANGGIAVELNPRRFTVPLFEEENLTTTLRRTSHRPYPNCSRASAEHAGCGLALACWEFVMLFYFLSSC